MYPGSQCKAVAQRTTNLIHFHSHTQVYRFDMCKHFETAHPEEEPLFPPRVFKNPLFAFGGHYQH